MPWVGCKHNPKKIANIVGNGLPCSTIQVKGCFCHFFFEKRKNKMKKSLFWGEKKAKENEKESFFCLFFGCGSTHGRVPAYREISAPQTFFSQPKLFKSVRSEVREGGKSVSAFTPGIGAWPGVCVFGRSHQVTPGLRSHQVTPVFSKSPPHTHFLRVTRVTRPPSGPTGGRAPALCGRPPTWRPPTSSPPTTQWPSSTTPCGASTGSRWCGSPAALAWALLRTSRPFFLLEFSASECSLAMVSGLGLRSSLRLRSQGNEAG